MNMHLQLFLRQSDEVIVETGTGARARNLLTGETEAGGLPQFKSSLSNRVKPCF